MKTARSSRVMNTLWNGLYETDPLGTMPVPFDFAFCPNHRKMICGIATKRPSTDTSRAVSLAVRRKRNNPRSRTKPTIGAVIPTDTSNAKAMGHWCVVWRS